MSGEVSRTKQRKAATKTQNSSNKNGSSASKSNLLNGKQQTIKPSTSSLCVRLLFYTLLSIFVVIATLISIDYRAGHLKQAYQTNIPKEIRTHIDQGALLAIEGFDSIYSLYRDQIKEGTNLARSWVRGVDFGGVDLEQLLFAEEIQEEKIEIAQRAAEKIKLAVDAVNKKIEEDKKNQQEAEATKSSDDDQIDNEIELEKIKIAKEAANQQMLEALEEEKRKQEAEELKEKLELQKQKEEALRIEKEVQLQKQLEQERLEKKKLEEKLKKIEEDKKKQEEAERQKAAEKVKKHQEAEAKHKAKVEEKRKKMEIEENEKLNKERDRLLEQNLKDLEKKHAELEAAAKDDIERKRLRIIHKTVRDQFEKNIKEEKDKK